MSFASAIRNELNGVFPTARHCVIAELAGLFLVSGYERASADGTREMVFRTEQKPTARKVFTLIHKAFKIVLENTGTGTPGRRRMREYQVVLRKPDETENVKAAFSHRMLLSMECCRRAFLRGAFLAGGSVSTPEKYYHLEIVCPDEASAERVRETMRSLDLEAKAVLRKGSHVVYLKEVEQIVRMLGLMGANISLLEFENIRIVREMRGAVNRKVNCETANLRKTVQASVRQTEDIEYLERHIGFERLPDTLRSMAEVRLRYPDAPLGELGGYLQPPVGKSGVNHRLRKLQELAAQLRSQREEKGETQ